MELTDLVLEHHHFNLPILGVETTDPFTGTPRFGFLFLNFPITLIFAVTWRSKLLLIWLEGSDRK